MAFFFSCRPTEDFILDEKDLIPEGTAHHPKNNSLLIGSIYKQKILELDQDGNVSTLIPQTEFGDLSPIGLIVDAQRDILWVNVALAPIVNQSKSKDWRTTVYSFDLNSRKKIKEYHLIEGGQVFLNDITVMSNGDVYCTESVHNAIYKIDATTDTLIHFVTLEGFNFPNGITHCGESDEIFVAVDEGIIKLNLITKEYILLETPEGVNASTIDGLECYKNSFIGHQSSKITRFYYNDNIESIVRAEEFDSGKEFDSSTTGAIGKGVYHYIVNSQIRSGVDRENHRLKPLDSLESIIIRRKRLK